MLSEDNSSGSCVVQLENDLNTVNSSYNLQTDGVFGSGVRIAVLDFQGRNHLGADGLVGATTADELSQQAEADGSVATPMPSQQSPGDESDEGSAEPMGKSAVDCFIERVKDKIPDDVIQNLIAGHLGKKELLDKLEKYGETPLDAAKAAWCVTFG
jgi:peptidoglycan hydrolase-like protein with peptidoglycan-binding domain